jgi:hypothetical protein
MLPASANRLASPPLMRAAVVATFIPALARNGIPWCFTP